jgi:hypothetical protein
MRRLLLVTVLALGAWVCWSGAAQAQTTTTLLNVSGTCSAGNATNPRGSTYYAQIYTISLTAGGSYTFTNNTYQFQQNFNANWTYDDYGYLLGPNGAVVTQDDDSNGNLQFKMTYTVPAGGTGTYTIVVTTWQPNLSQQFNLVVTGPPSTTPPPVPPTTGIPNVRLTPDELRLGDQRTLVSWNLMQEPRGFLGGTQVPSQQQWPTLG